ncbi:hypothetical protein QJS10_CPA10g00433 [Acorus calamus]|uniref:Uncharacterized protein n=1 Tax=Acorus calamus TaxID=4465 RepID=A0AAV9E0A2_ACOCL|nr:hypothetical protein QJS10_CPA10g00433 [Acorus calamus]
MRNPWLGVGNGSLFQGPIPESLSKLSRLTKLELGSNALNGSLPSGLGELSNLVYLDISSNQLSGFLSEAHFSKLLKLKILIASSNSLSMNVSSDWVPPYRLRNLDMGSIRLGPSFPPWLETQKLKLMFLDMLNTSINDEMPSWFWDQLSLNLSLLNITFNRIRGEFPNPLKVPAFADVSMKSNLLEGPLPIMSNGVRLLDLSDNRFSGSILPNIRKLQTLYLQHNRLSQTIPRSLGNCESLETIDLGSNTLLGEIPIWVRERLKRLRILSLRSNSFSGDIPEGLCNLTSLQVLDLSGNRLTGPIPRSLRGLIAMSRPRASHCDFFYGSYRGQYYKESLSMKVKGGTHTYTNILSLVISIDVLENALPGEIPEELMSLKGMVILNLSGTDSREAFRMKSGT